MISGLPESIEDRPAEAVREAGVDDHGIRRPSVKDFQGLPASGCLGDIEARRSQGDTEHLG
jgi:hypothetical protein